MQNVTATVVMAEGVLDFHKVNEIARAVAALAEQGQVKLVIDWSGVESINPLAIGVLLARHHALINAGGEIKFSRMRMEIRSLFCKFRVDELFESYATLEDAIESFDEEWDQKGRRHEA